MKQFKIYHPERTEANIMGMNLIGSLSTTDKYLHVATVEANELNDVFELTQNFPFNEEYMELNIRSTSVGDIVENVQAKKYYMVQGIGYAQLSVDEFNSFIKLADEPIEGDYTQTREENPEQ